MFFDGLFVCLFPIEHRPKEWKPGLMILRILREVYSRHDRGQWIAWTVL